MSWNTCLALRVSLCKYLDITSIWNIILVKIYFSCDSMRSTFPTKNLASISIECIQAASEEFRPSLDFTFYEESKISSVKFYDVLRPLIFITVSYCRIKPLKRYHLETSSKKISFHYHDISVGVKKAERYLVVDR